MNPLLAYSIAPKELRLPSGRSVSISVCFHSFKRWRGKAIKHTHGAKPMIDFKGKPLFAELSILRLIQKNGWQGVWIDSWRKKFRKSLPPNFCALPPSAEKFLDKINSRRKWCGGCFDLFAWNDKRYLFVESKWIGHDRIKANQKEWLESALNSGAPLNSFLIFEWTF